jgi:dTDP-glucose 4,6-dehydratase
MKTVIVTGGLGFIGSNLIKILNKKKYFVINIDKVTYAANFKNIPINIKNYKFYKQDINNKNFLKKILKTYKPSIIFNLAAETHVDRSIENPNNFINTNILGVFNILEVLREHKQNTKLVHVSTDEVYGDIINKRSSKEEDRYNPSSPYAASKAGSDLLILSYVRTFKTPAIITNCCNNFGPGQFPEKLIPTIINNIIKNKNIPIYGNGTNSREWIYVDDHSEGLIAVSKKGLIGHQYNIGSGIRLNNLDIANKILLLFKKITKQKTLSKIVFVKDRPGHDMCYSLNSEKIKKNLDWKTKHNINDALSKTIIWYISKFKDNFFDQKNYGKRIGLIND